jgi:hypothetical protein
VKGSLDGFGFLSDDGSLLSDGFLMRCGYARGVWAPLSIWLRSGFMGFSRDAAMLTRRGFLSNHGSLTRRGFLSNHGSLTRDGFLASLGCAHWRWVSLLEWLARTFWVSPGLWLRSCIMGFSLHLATLNSSGLLSFFDSLFGLGFLEGSGSLSGCGFLWLYGCAHLLWVSP